MQIWKVKIKQLRNLKGQNQTIEISGVKINQLKNLEDQNQAFWNLGGQNFIIRKFGGQKLHLNLVYIDLFGLFVRLFVWKNYETTYYINHKTIS